jgi:hypothetical protein
MTIGAAEDFGMAAATTRPEPARRSQNTAMLGPKLWPRRRRLC